MGKYEITLYDNKSRAYSSFTIESNKRPDFHKMALLEKSMTKSFSHISVMTDDGDVSIY